MGDVITVERDGTRARAHMYRPDPPESDYLVKIAPSWRHEYHFVGYAEDVPVYEVR